MPKIKNYSREAPLMAADEDKERVASWEHDILNRVQVHVIKDKHKDRYKTVVDKGGDRHIEGGWFKRKQRAMDVAREYMRMKPNPVDEENLASQSEIQVISHDRADDIILGNDDSTGRYGEQGLYRVEGKNEAGRYTFIDNSTGDAWTEEFDSLMQGRLWVRGSKLIDATRLEEER